VTRPCGVDERKERKKRSYVSRDGRSGQVIVTIQLDRTSTTISSHHATSGRLKVRPHHESVIQGIYYLPSLEDRDAAHLYVGACRESIIPNSFQGIRCGRTIRGLSEPQGLTAAGSRGPAFLPLRPSQRSQTRVTGHPDRVLSMLLGFSNSPPKCLRFQVGSLGTVR